MTAISLSHASSVACPSRRSTLCSHSPLLLPASALPPQYYEHASSLNYIPDIRTPTLFLMSEDDPFLGVLPDVECASNPSTLLAATARGGHVAFLQGLWPFGGAFMGESGGCAGGCA